MKLVIGRGKLYLSSIIYNIIIISQALTVEKIRLPGLLYINSNLRLIERFIIVLL